MMTISNGMNDILEFIKRDVSYAEYKSGNTWRRINIHDIIILPGQKIGIYIMFGTNEPDTITGIRLYNTAGVIWSQDSSVLISKSNFPEGVLYRFTITLVQETET